MERTIGETFTFKGTIGETFTFKRMKLTVKPWNHIKDCEKCFFFGNCDEVECRPRKREDGENVYFHAEITPEEIPYHPKKKGYSKCNFKKVKEQLVWVTY